MKNCIIFISFAFLNCIAQSPRRFEGESGTFVEFIDEKHIRFCVVHSSGLGEVTDCGCGSVSKRGSSYIMTRTASSCDFSGISKSTFTVVETDVLDLQFIVADYDGNPIKGVFVQARDGDGHLKEVVVAAVGTVRLREIPLDSIFYVSFLGYHPLQVKVNRFTNLRIDIALFPGTLGLLEGKKFPIKLSPSKEGLLLNREGSVELLLKKK